MKLKSASIRNFKGLKELDLDFAPGGGAPSPMTALTGENGAGKTSALQAISLALSLATRRTRYPEDLNWHGFRAERAGALGETRIALQVLLDETERAATRELFESWESSLTPEFRQTHNIIPPSDLAEIPLEFVNGRLQSPHGFSALNQFLGRYYILTLGKTKPWHRDKYDDIGGVFWFDAMRNLGRISIDREAEERDPRRRDDRDPIETWECGVEQLRDYLIGWWSHHTSPKRRGRDYILDLERNFRLVFPDISFRGVDFREGQSRGRFTEPYFLMEREGRVFDVSEMSGGEQAVFPLIYEFVRLNISKSVVLIDEPELNLGPAKTRQFLEVLPKIGPECQFILATNSAEAAEFAGDVRRIESLPAGR